MPLRGDVPAGSRILAANFFDWAVATLKKQWSDKSMTGAVAPGRYSLPVPALRLNSIGRGLKSRGRTG
jgi:hypothetical protein